jgi:hypothetical protein
MTSTFAREVMDVVLAFQEIENGSDRACAITACALIDDRIEISITARLANDPMAVSKFFDLDSGITAEAKIILAYLTGVYTDETRKNLIAMSRMRNKFAHRMDIRDFDHAEFHDLFKMITIPKVLTKDSRWVRGGDFDALTPETSKRGRFISTAKLLIHWLVEDIEDRPPPVFTPRF